jgi:hypothetical protein
LLLINKCLGEHKTTIEALLQLCAPKDGEASGNVPVDLENEGTIVGKLRVHLQRFDTVATDVVKQAEHYIQELAPGDNVSHITDAVDAGAKFHLATALKWVLHALERIKAIGDVVAKARSW